jgi:hypothetical protein
LVGKQKATKKESNLNLRKRSYGHFSQMNDQR